MKTLVLLDAHALIHRAYHALPPFISKNTGEPTGALYGLSTMLLKVIRELKPDYLVAAYDLPGPTFRHDAYTAYKATRKEADAELIAQLKRSHDVVAAFGIPDISAPGFEADDILGTIVEQCRTLSVGHDLKIIIVSGDMDVLQLIDDDKVVVYTMRKGLEDTVIYDEKKVEERYGFGPGAIPDYKGLRGDASDNIIGVPGIGEKTATDIIKNFGNLEDLYEKLEAPPSSKSDFPGKSDFFPGGVENILKPRIIQLLKDHKKDAFFSKTLATIRRDVPIKFEIPKTSYKTDIVKIKQLFNELGFQRLVSRLDGAEK